MQLDVQILVGAAGVALLLLVLRDAFETMILPRRLHGRLRLTRLSCRGGWPLWAGGAGRLRSRGRRESALALFGPFSMLLLFVLWAVVLMLGFGCLFWGLGSPLQTSEPLRGFAKDVYLSGVTLLTLGIGGAVPATNLARVLVVLEGGLGLGFVAVIISYLPVLYSGFSRREANIAMLDARAGSPPSASELLRRHAADLNRLEIYLGEWERWAAELLESHVSYPVLGYFRSQHANQSWLSALGAVLDACAVLVAGAEDGCMRQARLTFAIARHTIVDVAQLYLRRLPASIPNRLPPEDRDRLLRGLQQAGLAWNWDDAYVQRLNALRQLYEPHLCAMADHLRLEAPRWLGDAHNLDNWQRSPWDRPPAFLNSRPGADRHF
ncbi:MAG: ion channel [Terriglobales bacterium]